MAIRSRGAPYSTGIISVSCCTALPHLSLGFFMEIGLHCFVLLIQCHRGLTGIAGFQWHAPGDADWLIWLVYAGLISHTRERFPQNKHSVHVGSLSERKTWSPCFSFCSNLIFSTLELVGYFLHSQNSRMFGIWSNFLNFARVGRTTLICQ